MKIVGIIAEYNPFHNGHKYHLEQAKAVTGAQIAVAVISGPVTQRGEAAAWDKWTRAAMAVENGVDLVLELPFAFACNSAEEFARGGVAVLRSLGCVTDLVFGCESDPETLISMASASVQNEDTFQAAIAGGMEEGLSYPAARSRALLNFLPEKEGKIDRKTAWDRPNDILGAEYVRQLLLQKTAMVPHGVLRRGGYHDSEIQEPGEGELRFSSATAIRRAWKEQRREEARSALPAETRRVLEGRDGLCPCETDGLDGMILYRLLQLGPEGLRSVYGCSEGLEYRLWNALPQCRTAEELLAAAASGRYPTARLRRLLMHALVGTTDSEFQRLKETAMKEGLYARVLGCSEAGAGLLRQIKLTRRHFGYTNLNRELSKEEKRVVRGEVAVEGDAGQSRLLSLKWDVRAADVCRLARGEALYDGSDFVTTPYIGHKNEKTTKSS